MEWNRIALIIGTVSGMAVGFYPEARASWRTMHALSCAVVSGSVIYSSGQAVNTSASTAAQLDCPIDSDTSVWSTNSTVSLTVSGYSNSANGFQARACVTYQAGSGGSCSTAAASTGAGVVQLAPPTSAWTTNGVFDYPYVSVTLLPQVAGSSNVVWGYKMQN